MNGRAGILARAVAALEEAQWRSRDEISAAQRRQLVQLAQQCERFSPHFRGRLRAAGLTPADLGESLEKLPLLPRRALQSAADVFCTAVPQNHMPLAETRTSGSTGEPVVVKRTAVNNIDWLATTMREHLWHKRDFSGRFCAIRANIPKLVQLDSWGPPASLLCPTGAALGMPITLSVDEQVALILEFRPQILLVYPNVLSAFVQRAETDGMRFPELKQILSVGETLPSHLRARAAGAFDVEVADMYSSQEAGNIALQCPQSGLYHVMAESLIVEVVDDAGHPLPEGKIGRVAITDLHNYATPLIRYDIGDYAEAGPACACGRGLPTLKRILGRERNLIRLPDGSRTWPLFGGHYFRDVAPVVQFQGIQHSLSRIEIRLVCERAPTPGEEQGLRNMILKALGHPFEIEFVYFPDRIPAGPGGKFEEFICKVSDP
ncbi:MAG TPA: AMP-binding protein [Rhizomicrobium sp.]|nr:AMP-binding protein [Rhizomicrobium sp.]